MIQKLVKITKIWLKPNDEKTGGIGPNKIYLLAVWISTVKDVPRLDPFFANINNIKTLLKDWNNL